MSYKFEMHFHTVEVSACAQVPAPRPPRPTGGRATRGVVVTDTTLPTISPVSPAIGSRRWMPTWTASVPPRRLGSLLGLTVLLGLELRLDGTEKSGEPVLDALRDSINEYLVYGVTESSSGSTPRCTA